MDYHPLLEQINHAFADAAAPQVRVAPHHCGECDNIVDFLQGREREALSQAQAAVFGNTQIHLIAPEAIHYYFPNILAKALDPAEGDFLMDTLYFLSHADEHSHSQFKLFNAEQRQAVYHFLSHIEEHRQKDVQNYLYEEELQQALRNWKLSSPTIT